MRKVEMIVPTPAPVPLIPLTVATESLRYRSDGSTRAIVENDAYANVETANRAARANKLDVKIVGIRRVIPRPPNTTTALRALITGQPRRINQLESPPPKKLPRSAATNGIQNASNACSGLIPLVNK